MPTTSVRRRISRFSRSSELFDHSCRQCSFGCAVKGEDLRAWLVEQRGRLRESALELSDDPAVLLADPVGVGLGEDRSHHRRHEALGALRDVRQQVPHEVRAAALPAGAGQRRRDRVDEPRGARPK
jgi:hypothetical protein